MNKTLYTNVTRPQVDQTRANVTRLIVLGGALSLVAYDAYVSYRGFDRMGLPDLAPLIFAGIIFITQLAMGLLHALGEDYQSVKAGSNTQFLDDAWGWVLVIVYGLDIGSNTVEYGLLDLLPELPKQPVETLGSILLITGLAISLTFADEVLLRIHDKIVIACKRNGIYSRRYNNRIKAHQTYIAAEQSRMTQDAEAAGRKSTFNFGDDL